MDNFVLVPIGEKFRDPSSLMHIHKYAKTFTTYITNGAYAKPGTNDYSYIAYYFMDSDQGRKDMMMFRLGI